MKKNELIVEDLHVNVGEKEILSGVSFNIPEGETHILFGPNGCGKTTLLMTLMGFPKYKISSGRIIYKGVDITEMPMHERAKLGMGISFQKPPVVKGVLLKKIISILAEGEKNIDQKMIEELNMKNYLYRDLNEGFSGGEIKRSEMLQLAHQRPDLLMMDEPESGVDIENLKVLGNVAQTLLQRTLEVKIKDRKKIGLIITHTGYILDYVNADKAYIMIDGQLTCSGNAMEIFKEIQTKGFKGCFLCQTQK